MSMTLPPPQNNIVTFVAMGNGAPDLSANISAIRNGSVQLSAGALTGAEDLLQGGGSWELGGDKFLCACLSF